MSQKERNPTPTPAMTRDLTASVLPTSNRWSNFLTFTPESLNTLSRTARVCSRLAPDQRQSLKISCTFHSFNRPSQLRVRDSSGKDRNDFIRHKLLKANPWTPLMALHQTESHAVFSKVVQHFFCVSNDELKTGVRVVMTESNEDPRHKMSGQSCARRQFHSSRDFSGLI